MSAETHIITCDTCRVRIVLFYEQVRRKNTFASDGVIEIDCPSCGFVNRIWYVAANRAWNKQEMEDAKFDSYFTWKAKTSRENERARLAQLEAVRLEQERAKRQEAQRLADEQNQREAAEQKRVAASKLVSARSSSDDDGDSGSGSSGRFGNDDRSDSMNPNNDAYHASQDNRSDQMNPNNSAYGSSRGH